MKRTSHSLLLLLLLPVCAQSQTGGQELVIARECLSQDEVTIVHTCAAYTIVAAPDSGYAIIACGDEPRLIGYSRSSTWHESEMPTQLREWLCDLERRAEDKQTTGDRHYNNTKAITQNRAAAKNRRDVAPLLTCHWHQQSPYNDLTPVIADGNVKTAAGCVAVAAAQIAYYWRTRLPKATLRDTPVYPYGGAPVTLSIPAGSPNRWELMQDEYRKDDDSEARAAAAQLVYVIGTTAYLQYAASTGGHIKDAANALYAQFRMTSQPATKADYDEAGWETLLYGELYAGRPILYAGESTGDAHAVVVDGYDAAHQLFHFNFGWGGSGDGYYTVDDNSGMNGYSSAQHCVLHITPTADTGVGDAAADGTTPGSAATFDLTGRPLTASHDRPHRGIYVTRGRKWAVR